MRQGEGRTAPVFLGQYVRMLRSDRASAEDDGLGRAESRPSRIGPINLDVKQMGERSAGNPHAAFDVAGAGNVARSKCFGRSRRASPRPDHTCGDRGLAC
jgi:hypothetical protein